MTMRPVGALTGQDLHRHFYVAYGSAFLHAATCSAATAVAHFKSPSHAARAIEDMSDTKVRGGCLSCPLAALPCLPDNPMGGLPHGRP